MLLRDCYASNTVRAPVLFTLLLTCMPGVAQLVAPTAISDAGYTACSHASCLLVPDDEHPQVYRQGDLSYTLKEGGSFTLSRDSKVLLSTDLADLSASVFVTWSSHSDWLRSHGVMVARSGTSIRVCSTLRKTKWKKLTPCKLPLQIFDGGIGAEHEATTYRRMAGIERPEH